MLRRPVMGLHFTTVGQLAPAVVSFCVQSVLLYGSARRAVGDAGLLARQHIDGKFGGKRAAR